MARGISLDNMSMFITHADINFCVNFKGLFLASKLAMKVNRESTEVVPYCADLS